MSSTETAATADTLPLRVLPTEIPGMPNVTLRLSIPEDGVRDRDIVVRPPRENDVEALAPAFADPVIRETGNLPVLDRQELLDTLPHLPFLAASGRLLPLVVADAELGDVLGGAALHHLDAERGIVEIGYWLFPHARGRGVATRTARLLAEPCLLARCRAGRRLRQRRQRRLRPRARARRLHARRRRALAPETRRDQGGQDPVLDPARRIGRARRAQTRATCSSATSTSRQSAFTSCISSIVRQRASSSRGEQTRIARH